MEARLNYDDVEEIKVENQKIDFEFHPGQEQIFFDDEDDVQFKLVPKGRRFGLTRGFAKFAVLNMLAAAEEDEGIYILWVDTIYSNIERYFDRYFRPELKKFPKQLWRYNRNKNEFSFANSALDFRSADKPENVEGFGYHIIIINEAGIVLKKKELWQESILPMILDYKAEVIIGGTPKGKKTKNRKTGKKEAHLFFELYQRGMDEKEKKYKSYQFSTYDNPIINDDDIKELEKEIPSHLIPQEVHGKFIDVISAGIIKKEWFIYYEDSERASKKFHRRIQIWDTAFKTNQENDFNVCLTWEILSDGYYLINVFRERMEFPELKKKAEKLYELYKPNQVWIEDKASGQSLIQELRRNTRIPIKEIEANKDKMEYVNAAAPIIESGLVKLPFHKNWTEDFVDECVEFPDVEFDDQVDIMSKFLNEAKSKSSEREIKGIVIQRNKLRRQKYYNYRKR